MPMTINMKKIVCLRRCKFFSLPVLPILPIFLEKLVKLVKLVPRLEFFFFKDTKPKPIPILIDFSKLPAASAEVVADAD